MENVSDEVQIYKNPVELLRKLIQFNTTNPPGNEAECILYINSLLHSAGIETMLLESKPSRPNLVARLKGSGSTPPFLMFGHVDVVGTEGQRWKYPPFEAQVAEGCIWGRGALDMKGAVAMMVSALIRAKMESFSPKGDIILAVVSDEEDGGNYGARYLVEQHGELFKEVRYAISEVGGVTLHLGGKKFYPIMIAEKQRSCLKAVVHGHAGHGSMPMHNGTMAKLGMILSRLNNKRLPVHITQPARLMIEAIAGKLPFPSNFLLKGLLYPPLTGSILNLLGANGSFFEAILYNTVNATIVRGGDKINVIPSEIVLEFDGRILPGLSAESVISELTALIGMDDIELELTHYDQGPEKIDMGLFNLLSDVLTKMDKDAIPIPFVVSGTTDARFFAQLGIHTYGFTPMILPKEISIAKLIHAANERIPVESVEQGTNAILDLLKRL